MPDMGLCRLLGAVLLAIGLFGPAQAEVLFLRNAQVLTVAAGQRDEFNLTLPFHWDRVHRGQSGEAVLEFRFALSEVPAGLNGIYFPRVGNRAEIHLNDTLLARYGEIRTGNSEDYAKTPRYLPLPERLLRPENVLRVVIEADSGRRGGLLVPMIGPADELLGVYRHNYRWRVTGSLVVVVFSFVVGVIAFLLWITQRAPGSSYASGSGGRDGLYLSACLAELFWVVRISDIAMEHPPLGWLWWNALQTLVFAGWVFGVGMFCHHVAGWQHHPSMRWMQRVLGGIFLTAVPVALAGRFWYGDILQIGWYGLITVLFFCYGAAYVWMTVRQPSVERVLVAIAGLTNVAVGARDWVVIRASDNFGEISWIRYSSVLLGLTLLYIVGSRFRRSSEQARDLTDEMTEKVREKEQALAASYGRLEQLAREQERAAERTRILRDMHDGVGSHISAAIRQLQSGRASNEQLLQTLRDSLDQLKLSIDAMNLPAGDVTALLANLRYRLEPRLATSGIELVWDVAEVAPLARLDDKAMRQLQFMVFEAISNVLQHARADRLTLELRGEPAGGVTLRVRDNGRGFDVAQVPRRGLASLRERAAAIGARLNIASEPGRTVVEIVLA